MYYKFKMKILIFVFYLKSVIADSSIFLTVLPLGKNIVLEENVDLNLTCKVESNGRPFEKYDLTWSLPTRSNSNGNRITIYELNDQLTVTIHSLQEVDSGSYVCKLKNNGIIRTEKISLYVRSKKCGKHFFDCGNGVCVPKHYVCDGYRDCPTGFDEAFKHCGSDACQGKILCDGRCIPKEYCCDPIMDSNCSVNYVMPCCTGFLHQGLHHGTFEHDDPLPCSASVDCHFNRFVGFGSSVVYIVASCAVVVIIVSAVVMFLACRICSQRSEELHRLSRVTNSEFERQLTATLAHRDLDTIEHVDGMFDENGSDPYSSSEAAENFLLMSYEDGALVGFGNCGPKPPPYTENAIGIPPPPYESVIDIPSAIKDEETQDVVDNVRNED